MQFCENLSRAKGPEQKCLFGSAPRLEGVGQHYYLCCAQSLPGGSLEEVGPRGRGLELEAVGLGALCPYQALLKETERHTSLATMTY